jgi:hypothetical protein
MQRGFYVEGLSEYAVRSFEEAVAVLNWGLENRVLGATKMNATSSRSHTVLTVRIEARSACVNKYLSRIISRQLLADNR